MKVNCDCSAIEGLYIMNVCAELLFYKEDCSCTRFPRMLRVGCTVIRHKAFVVVIMQSKMCVLGVSKFCFSKRYDIKLLTNTIIKPKLSFSSSVISLNVMCCDS